MSMPFIKTQKIIDYLESEVKCNQPPIQVIDVFPAEDDLVSYGLYVNGINTVSRDAFQMAIQKCGSIYTVTDEFQILFVSFQNDPQADLVESVIQKLAQDVEFFDGYNQVTYTVDEEIGNRSEKSTYTFNLQRTEFNSQLIKEN
jgi:hypothetical protein